MGNIMIFFMLISKELYTRVDYYIQTVVVKKHQQNNIIYPVKFMYYLIFEYFILICTQVVFWISFYKCKLYMWRIYI